MNFRHWLQEMWQEHCDELLAHGRTEERRSVNSTEYFQKYKWWLKREYVSQCRNKSK